MSLWHCIDRCSGESFYAQGSDEDSIRASVETYLRDGIDADVGEVEYDVEASAVDGSLYIIDGTVCPDEDDDAE